jgi:threonine/homoserine/homoserine lactone efflux protein
MPSLETIFIVCIAGFTLSASPGPSMFYIVSRTIGQGRTAGFASLLGLALGGVLLAIAAALGLTVIVRSSATVYSAIKILGAIYLVYLGTRGLLLAIRKSNHSPIPESLEKQSPLTILIQGMLVEFLNPKTILFFIAFIPQFVELSRPDVMLQMLILGSLVPLTAIPSDLVVVLTSSTILQRIRHNSKIALMLDVLSGVILIGIGIHLWIS